MYQYRLGAGHLGEGTIESSVATQLPRQVVDTPGRESRRETVRRLVTARSTRRSYLSSALFGEPAWDILLNLYALSFTFRRTSLSKVHTLSAVPPTTTLRCVRKLESAGLVIRVRDPLDARRIWIELSNDAVSRIEAYLDHIQANQLG